MKPYILTNITSPQQGMALNEDKNSIYEIKTWPSIHLNPNRIEVGDTAILIG